MNTEERNGDAASGPRNGLSPITKAPETWKPQPPQLVNGWYHYTKRDGTTLKLGYEAATVAYRIDLCDALQSSYDSLARELEQAKADNERLREALQRIAHAKADGLDGARDTLVLERAIKVASAALKSTMGNQS